MSHVRAEIVVDLDAIAGNVSTLKDHVRATSDDVAMMTVVKADGYGHGMPQAARAARAGGADWLGVATLDEALALRATDSGPVLCWLTVPGEDYGPAIEQGIDLTAYTLAELDEIVTAARRVGRVARVQLKVDTGLSRGGAAAALWPDLVTAAARAERSDVVHITGVWSHLAASDEPEHPANDRQQQAFETAVKTAYAAGLEPDHLHLANSAAAILRPEAHYTMVRCGIASYGLSPAPGRTEHLPLVPAMTVRAELAVSKRVARGDGVSYGHTWIADRDTTVGVIPAGYAEGIPIAASNRAEVWVGGSRRPLRGRVCMDQVVVDLGGEEIPPGAEALLFGPGDRGEPTAQDWAQWCDTINYEIVCRIGGRLRRRYTGATAGEGS